MTISAMGIMTLKSRVFGVAVLAAGFASAAPVSFNRDIRPIMSDTCFRCHGPDKGARMAELRLDIRDEALKAKKNGTPIVPGDPEHSLIILRIFETKPARIMPPEYAHKILTPAQKDTVRRWVAEGAKYEGHWAYQPVKRPAVPDVSAGAPVRNPIDAFVQARLAGEGLSPSPEADRRTLIRRVTLDLTGLPPGPREVEEFVNDRSPNAYEKIVDRLLGSPQYAEKQAMHWLDAVRYADTCGFHGDNPLPAWPYRDYVLRAFRDNKPFDEFTREQLAGDLLPNATVEQKVASAYNRLNRTSAEGGLQPKEYLAKYGADRVRTLSAVWLGSTMGCAECHDHKFDPFLSKDFYSMKAFFADIKETGLVPDQGPEAWGSQLALPTAEQRTRLEALTHKVFDTRCKLDDKAESLMVRRREWEKDLLARYEAGELNWRFQRPLSAAANQAKLTIYNEELVEANESEGASLVTRRVPGNGLIIASGPNPDNEMYTVTFKPGEGAWTALGLEVDSDESLPGAAVARGADRFVVSELEAELSLDGAQPAQKLSFILATTNANPAADLPAMGAIDGNPKTGWGVSTYGGVRDPFLALRFPEKVKTRANSVITVRLHQSSEYRRATIGRFRLALSAGEYSWPEAQNQTARRKESKEPDTPVNGGLPLRVYRAIRIPEADRDNDQNNAVRDHFEWSAPELAPMRIEVAKLETERGLLDTAIPKVVVTEATTPRVTRILPRANWMDETSPIVEPAVPVFLGKLETGDRRATRLDLANWLVSPENPLTARTFVNRTWREFFGTGLTKVLEDLGSQGEWPTYLDLLDWLAAEFMQPSVQAEGTHAWDVRHLIRTIVLSHTYRQSSQSNPQLDEKDFDNHLLARQTRVRVDAEVVRDTALEVSGLLVEKFGGPSVKPYQPDGYLAALNFPKREYAASRSEDLYRRGVYTYWQRTFLHPSLATFDAPTREECTVNRVNSNTPLQALVLLNDPIYVEAARVFAQNILQQGGRSMKSRLDWAFLRALSRQPTPEERRILTELHRKNLARFRTDQTGAGHLARAGEAPGAPNEKASDLAAMTSVARVILNLHEVITRN
ncbi:MAG: PSD1 domain-containing protein [Candidatus Solibacter usitatus]|nr:PSD1 domain-containing protein [Candidatus Solibacter usitatus]